MGIVGVIGIILATASVVSIIVQEKQRRKIQNIKTYPQEQNHLPKRLMTKQDIESVLNYYLLDHWDMSHEYIDGFYHVTITFKQPLLTKRKNLLKKYIEEHKMIGMIVNYN